MFDRLAGSQRTEEAIRKAKPLLSGRLIAQLALALDPSCQCPSRPAAHNLHVHSVGLTTAEIEAARQGLSFDVRDAAAVRLAKALHQYADRAADHRQQAARAGLPRALATAVEQFTRDFSACRHCGSP